MDLLGGYGSGSDSEPASPPAAGNRGTAQLLPDSPPRPAAAPVSANPATSTDPSKLLSSLPVPSGGKVSRRERERRLGPPQGMTLAALSPSCLSPLFLPLHLSWPWGPAGSLASTLPPGATAQGRLDCKRYAAWPLDRTPPAPPPLILLCPPLQAHLFSGLPAAKKKQQIKVQFRMPISYDPADVAVDPEEVRQLAARLAPAVLWLAVAMPPPFALQHASSVLLHVPCPTCPPPPPLGVSGAGPQAAEGRAPRPLPLPAAARAQERGGTCRRPAGRCAGRRRGGRGGPYGKTVRFR